MGARVRMLVPNVEDSQGTVVGYGRVQALVRVKPDGLKATRTYSPSFLERVNPHCAPA